MRFDVCISYAAADRQAVEVLVERLRDEAGLQPWFDQWHLIPGTPLQEALEEALLNADSCAIFVGAEGFQAWHQEEMRIAIQARISAPDYRVIPVLLPGADLPERGGLPPFLARHVWVDFRSGLDDSYAFLHLLSGIQGIAPERQSESLKDTVCPYLGLHPFQEQDAQFFFGRNALVQWLIEDLRRGNILAVIGASGSGKSSVVLAGLIPKLRQGAIRGSRDWPILSMKPGSEPIMMLATQLLTLLQPADPIAARRSLMESLRNETSGLAHAVEQILAGRSADGKEPARLLLVIDQFEELFTVCRVAAERDAFIDALLEATDANRQGLICVLTMRADFYSQLASLTDLGLRLERRQRVVGPMDTDELRTAIEEPAKLVGLHFEKGLISTILDDAGSEPGVLPLLAHTLWELCQKRRGSWLTFDAYTAMGGVRGALANHAEEAFSEFSTQDQAVVRQILLRLTRPGVDTEDTRQRALKSDLALATTQQAVVEEILQKLTEERLLIATRDDDSGQEMIDVAHEALIRGWPRLTQWVDEDRSGMMLHNRLTAAVADWEKHDKNDSYLYKGAQLASVSEWARNHNDRLSRKERLFLDRSQTVERRRRILISLLSLGATAIIAAVASLALTGQLNQWIYRPHRMAWIEVPAGIFVMGSPEAEEQYANENIPKADENIWYVLSNETPSHEVHLDAYEINRHEVTNREYRQCVRSTLCSPPNSVTWEDSTYDSFPITNVNWEQAAQFCLWIGGSMPTEAQWEKAARGPDPEPPRYPWGDDHRPQSANVAGQSTMAVGSFAPADESYYGAFDMVGNAWEWVHDFYAEDYYGQFMERQANNPMGPEYGDTHVLRGGSYDNDWIAARTTHRNSDLRPGDSSDDVGFRCVRQ